MAQDAAAPAGSPSKSNGQVGLLRFSRARPGSLFFLGCCSSRVATSAAVRRSPRRSHSALACGMQRPVAAAVPGQAGEGSPYLCALLQMPLCLLCRQRAGAGGGRGRLFLLSPPSAQSKGSGSNPHPGGFRACARMALPVLRQRGGVAAHRKSPFPQGRPLGWGCGGTGGIQAADFPSLNASRLLRLLLTSPSGGVARLCLALAPAPPPSLGCCLFAEETKEGSGWLDPRGGGGRIVSHRIALLKGGGSLPPSLSGDPAGGWLARPAE